MNNEHGYFSVYFWVGLKSLMERKKIRLRWFLPISQCYESSPLVYHTNVYATKKPENRWGVVKIVCEAANRTT